MSNGLDVKELSDFEKELIDLAKKKMPKETKKFLRTEGTKLKKITLSKAKTKVKEKTGNYFKSIKRGKVYLYSKNGALSIRVYSNAKHAHLIEEGHRQVTADGKEVGFVKGKKIFELSMNEFESQYFKDTEEFIDAIIEKNIKR